ncbi:MAG: DUF711 family protein [Anaerolineae bacterium]|nr:DUF711 family protein [Anaerolineae bacterium]
MKIRSITCFFNPAAPSSKDTLKRFATFVSQAVFRFNQAGFEVQTTRLATVPFPQCFPLLEPDHLLSQVQEWEAEASLNGFSYLSLGPALPEFPQSYAVIPALLAATRNVFFSAVMASRGAGVNLWAVKACARIITQNALLTPDGFTNLRFAALANVPPGAPFFPAAYHDTSQLKFALAVECADIARNAFSGVVSIAAGRKRLLNDLESAAQKLTTISRDLSSQFDLQFGGIDFSPAPFPLDSCSLAGAMETLGVPKIGLAGSLSAAAIIADTLDQGQWPRAGFNGLMLPVLEDSVLALRSGEGVLTIRDLLLFSAVCGAGLDTVPLPGGITPEELASLLADLAALSVRLDKPLTARLMPVPGKNAGERTGFDFEFFANGGVLPTHAAPLNGLLASDEIFPLKPRPWNGSSELGEN